MKKLFEIREMERDIRGLRYIVPLFFHFVKMLC